MAAKKTKKQKAIDAAFVKKISSITVGTGTKSSGSYDHSCPGCGEPISGYTVIPVAIPIHAHPPKSKPEPKPAPAQEGEVAFSA